MLTEKQQEIIDSLTSEFNKINKPTEVSSGLINIGGITAKFQAEKKAKLENELTQATWKQARYEEAKRIAKMLNADLIPIGLEAKIPNNNLDMVIITLSHKRICYTKEISIYIENKYQGHNEYGKCIITGMTYGFYSNPNKRVTLDIIEEVTHDKYFESKIKTLYALTEPNLELV